MNQNILIVEDDVRMRMLLSHYLKREGFLISEADNGDSALKILRTNKIDLLILDIMLPCLDGWNVCKSLRSFSDIPVIFLTARAEDEDIIKGYDLGADDYVTKPFSPKILVARSKALLKRFSKQKNSNLENNILTTFGIIVNQNTHEVLINEQKVNLTPKEYDLLVYLLKNGGVALSREQILNNVWGYSFQGELRTVDTHIWRLRDKLQEKGNIITSIRGYGYKLEV